MCESKVLSFDTGEQAIAKGGVACPFPWRLHELLQAAADEGLEDIVSWAPHGRAFIVHQPKIFAEGIMKRFFSHTKYPSFQRQLNLYGFSRFSHGKDKGAYYHLGFVRGHRHLVRSMKRVKIKGMQARKTSPQEEPNFYDYIWMNHFEASYPTHPSQLKSRIVSPRVASDESVVKKVLQDSNVRIVDHVPATSPLSSMHVGNVSDSDSSSWEASVFDEYLAFEPTQEEEPIQVIIPPSVLQNCPLYDDPFEPTPIRENGMRTVSLEFPCWEGSSMFY